MYLRLVLLRGNARTPDEEQLIDTVLVLYESYLHARRSKEDIALMLARDFAFHLGHHQQGLATKYGSSPPLHTVNHAAAVGPPPSMYAGTVNTDMAYQAEDSSLDSSMRSTVSR